MSDRYSDFPGGGHAAGFRPDIEGLRAVAVVLVLLYHAGLGFTGGYVGVDVFLVLSGFLITSVLLRQAEGGSFSLRDFWSRRARRLLAASTTVAMLTLFAGWALLEPARLAGLAGDALAAATFSSNIRFSITNSDYLAGLTLPSPLLHFWSLALEEQFYVVWPILVLAVSRSRRFRLHLGLLAGALLLASVVLSAFLTGRSPSFSYFMLPTRAWELLAGALLAILLPSVSRLPALLRGSVAWVGLILVLATAVLYGSSTVFPGVAAILPVTATVLVLLAGAGSAAGPAGLLSLRPLRWIGARSYALYLWHWPVLVLWEAGFGELTVVSKVAALLLSVLLSALSYRMIENPVRHSVRLALTPSRGLALGGLLSLSLLLSGVMLGRLAPSTESQVAAAVLPAEDTSATTSPAGDAPTLEQVAAPTSSTVTDVPVSAAVAPPGKTLLVGDSTLAPLRWFVDGEVSLTGFPYVLDAESCRRVHLASCRGREERTPTSASKALRDRAAAGEVFHTVVLMAGYHSDTKVIGREIDAFLKAARETGVERVVLLTFRESLAFPAPGSKGKASVYTEFNRIMRDRAARTTGPAVVVLDWHRYSAARKEWFRWDGIHANLTGTLALGEFISRSLAALDGRPCPDGASASPCAIPGVGPRSDLLARYKVRATNEHCYEIGSSRRPLCKRDKLA